MKTIQLQLGDDSQEESHYLLIDTIKCAA